MLIFCFAAFAADLTAEEIKSLKARLDKLETEKATRESGLKTQDLDGKKLSEDEMKNAPPAAESVSPEKIQEAMKTIEDYKVRREEEEKILKELDAEP